MISITLATRHRLPRLDTFVESIRETSVVMPEMVAYTDDDDPESYDRCVELGMVAISAPRRTMLSMWNECAKVASGDIVMFCGDDTVFKTPGWDSVVQATFDASDDKILFVHGDDGKNGDRPTMGFVHRTWIEAVGYLLPPQFTADYGDTWMYDVSVALDRHVYLPGLLMLHDEPEGDQTWLERQARGAQQNVAQLYKDLLPERLADIAKLRARMK